MSRTSSGTTRRIAHTLSGVSATALLRESGRAAFPVAPLPAFFPISPVPFVVFLLPFPAVVRRPLRRTISAPRSPRRRWHGIVADGNVENWRRHGHRWNDRPRTIPARADVPHVAGEAPVLVGVEEDVRRSLGRIVDRRS